MYGRSWSCLANFIYPKIFSSFIMQRIFYVNDPYIHTLPVHTAPYVPEPVCFNFLSVFYWLRFLFWPAPASAPIKKHGATSQPPHYEKFIYFLRIVVLNLHLINVETKKERSELQKIAFSQKLKPEPDIQPGYGQNVAALAPQH